MLQNLPATARRLRTALALRARPRARAGRLAAGLLALAGPALGGLRDATTRRLVQQEREWIERWHIDARHLYDLMSLYPALPRAFFIHIPKCGGTSIRQQLVAGHGMAPIPVPSTGAMRQSLEYMTSSGRYPPGCLPAAEEDLRSQFLDAFAAYRVAARPTRLFVLGHQRAREIRPLYRPGRDIVFSTVRPPVALLRSMVTYRVDHILRKPERPDSQELLAALQLDRDAFAGLVNADPRAATRRILATGSPSLASYLAPGERTDLESVWRGLAEHPVYVADVAEQDLLLAALFGQAPAAAQRNTSQGRTGLPGEFAAALQDEWLEPFVEPDSAALYRRLQSSGIIGFWRRGGTPGEYRQLLAAG